MGVTATDTEARFAFGENWARFLRVVDDARVHQSEASLQQMLGARTLGGRFLDIGSGSGLFSLAARRLGATVTSFDYDAVSVRCAEELRRRYSLEGDGWRIEQGSVLDAEYVASLGQFDVVYSWGVLHHTGAMWTAIDHASGAVRQGGQLFIAIYNDQGQKSVWWRRVKRTYTRLPRPLQFIYALAFATALEAGAVGVALARLRPQQLIDRWTRYEGVRGMSRWHDLVDWIGGYPFEVATPEAVVDFCRARGFALEKLRTCGGRMGCNEFVFRRTR